VVPLRHNHKGIALRIEPNLTKDSIFQRFRPVIYCENRPPLYEDTLEFIAGGLFGDSEIRTREILERIVYTKTSEWAYEEEYRLATPLRQNEVPWNTMPYHPEELGELFLGLALENNDADQIVNMALKINPKIAIFTTKRGSNGTLGFDRL
jgi:hypothetical protein